MVQTKKRTLIGGLLGSILVPGFSRLAHAEISEVALTSEYVENESYWEGIRLQFQIDPDLILLNAANLCPSPRSVLTTQKSISERLDSDPSPQSRAKLARLQETARDLIAQMIGAESTEVVITRNTTEGNSTVINGIGLGPGDEVVLWTENHESNKLAWQVLAQRKGFSVKIVNTPDGIFCKEDLRDIFVGAITSRTRVLAISHVSNVSGIRLPVETICNACRARNVLSLVDGAQSFGILPVDVRNIGCDFYTASLHKWSMGPKETGILYVNADKQADLWPQSVGLGYIGDAHSAATKFESLGQRDIASIGAIVPTLEFLSTIGLPRIEERVRSLVDDIREAVQQIPGAKILTPSSRSLSAGIIIFGLPNVSGAAAVSSLYQSERIVMMPASIINGVRVSPHIYNLKSEIQSAMFAIKNIV